MPKKKVRLIRPKAVQLKVLPKEVIANLSTEGAIFTHDLEDEVVAINIGNDITLVFWANNLGGIVQYPTSHLDALSVEGKEEDVAKAVVNKAVEEVIAEEEDKEPKPKQEQEEYPEGMEPEEEDTSENNKS